MKDFKRVLSLGLAGTMLAGMMTVGASAANKDFTDADEITHTEAVNVMSTLGVLQGKDTGAFDPTATVTRGEMAKIICVMLNGGNDPTVGTGGTPKFTDIANHWARGYIEYCANLGIIAGQGDGTFAPDAPVTGAAAAKMMLVALGYASDISGFTGIDWQLNVDSEANKAKLYDEIKGIDTSAGLSRDDTAQMAYNTLEAKIMERTDNKVVSTGEISYSYEQSKTTTFLNEYFDAYSFVGTFEGNDDTIDGLNDGFIRVNGRLDTVSATYDEHGEISNNRTANFPAELDIANIGEEVKVLFKDGRSGTSNVPDRNDTIYGVFNTGRTEVYNVTKGDIQDAENGANGMKLKFGGSKYDIAASVSVVTNYKVSEADPKTTGAALQSALKVSQSPDTIKLVCNEDGKISAAYIVEYKIARVSAINSTKLTIVGEKSLTIADNDVVEGLKVDDIVVYTKFYSDDAGDAFVTVTKAEEVEGELTGVKEDGGVANMVIDGTTYKVTGKTLVAVNDDALDNDDVIGQDATLDLGDDVKAYLLNGLVAAVEPVSETSSAYALIIGANGGTLDEDSFNRLQVKVVLSDGTTTTYYVDEDSVDDFEGYDTDSTDVPTLVKYTMSGTDIKITAKCENADLSSQSSATAWDESAKALMVNANGSTTVAASDAVLFVKNSNNSKYTVYNLRGLGDIKVAKMTSGSETVEYFTNTNGQAVAAYMILDGTPSGSTADTKYGIVTGYVGRRTVSGDTYYQWTIWTGEETVVNTSRTLSDTLAAGDIVTFEETSNGLYGEGEITVVNDLANNEYTPAQGYTAVAVRSYNGTAGILSYYTATEADGENNFKGTGTAVSKSVDDDVVIVYVDADEQDEGVTNGIVAFDPTTGYANALIVLDNDVVTAIIVETSGEVSLSKTFPTAGQQGGNEPATHSHTWGEYTLTDGKHVRECTGDGECTATTAEKEHNPEAADTYTTDGTQHWKVCKNCSVIVEEKANHTYDQEAEGGKCTVCDAAWVDPNA